MMARRSGGRHRAAQPRGPLASVALAGAVAALPLVTASPASAGEGTWSAIEQCESGGRNVENATSSASGYYQIIDGTWRGYGGRQFASRAIHATRAEQRVVAARIAAAHPSLSDWDASRSCWEPRVGRHSAAAPVQRTIAASTSAPRHAAVTGVRAADGTGRYVCDTAHLYFERCDISNLGAVVAYPLYDGHLPGR